MTLPYRQERFLRRGDRALCRSDPDLASMLSIFARVAAGERMPAREQLRPQLTRVWCTARARWIFDGPAAGLRLTARPGAAPGVRVKYPCHQRTRGAGVTLRWRGSRSRGDRPRIPTLLYVLQRRSRSPADGQAVCALTCRNAACRPGQLLVRIDSVARVRLDGQRNRLERPGNRLEPPWRSERPRCGVLQANRQPVRWTGRRLPRRPQERQSREVIDHMVVNRANARRSPNRNSYRSSGYLGWLLTPEFQLGVVASGRAVAWWPGVAGPRARTGLRHAAVSGQAVGRSLSVDGAVADEVRWRRHGLG